MRIWSLHPKYLDTLGLLAAWREGLLAQKVLRGETKGYRNHPQLERFKSEADPVGAISAYLRFIFQESLKRGYSFSADKIDTHEEKIEMTCTRGQLLYEWEHLKEKLQRRDAGKHLEVAEIKMPDAHPIFKIVEGDVESWEVRKQSA